MASVNPPIECDLSVLSREQREQLAALTDRLFPLTDDVRELPDGYALGFTDAPAELLSDAAVFIALDRLCCAFLRHGLTVDPGPGVAWLELTGGPDAKEAIADDIRTRVPDHLAASAGLVPPRAR